ncbi:MAG: RNA pseudouridine synthase [Treponema sp.]|nr:RNA pseudouridine synthase [Treponema sp.]
MRILFENEACLVINKLPGESSEFASPEFCASGGASAGAKFPAPAHRLDTPVSGCLLLAKTPNAAAFFGSAFAERHVEKRYWAIVEKPAGNPLAASGDLVHWLSFNSAKNKSFAHNEEKHGRKKAVLRYRIVGTGTNYLFLEIDLVTGRHHQIRAQLAALCLHIKGDLKYGARRSEKSGGIRLHAYSLAFPNPLRPGERIEAHALPPAMDNLWAAFAQSPGLPASS